MIQFGVAFHHAYQLRTSMAVIPQYLQSGDPAPSSIGGHSKNIALCPGRYCPSPRISYPRAIGGGHAVTSMNAGLAQSSDNNIFSNDHISTHWQPCFNVLTIASCSDRCLYLPTMYSTRSVQSTPSFQTLLPQNFAVLPSFNFNSTFFPSPYLQCKSSL